MRAMIVALDVDYRGRAEGGERAVVAAVGFSRWDASSPELERVIAVPEALPYEPGSFYKRELPCLLAALAAIEAEGASLEHIVVDGYVWLGSARPGLGMRLWSALGERVPVVGVAKTSFAGSESVSEPVLRGASKKPLWITAQGAPCADAARWVREMHGEHRVPTLLARADRLCRQG